MNSLKKIFDRDTWDESRNQSQSNRSVFTKRWKPSTSRWNYDNADFSGRDSSGFDLSTSGDIKYDLRRQKKTRFARQQSIIHRLQAQVRQLELKISQQAQQAAAKERITDRIG